jgi:hypothetical protein
VTNSAACAFSKLSKGTASPSSRVSTNKAAGDNAEVSTDTVKASAASPLVVSAALLMLIALACI